MKNIVKKSVYGVTSLMMVVLLFSSCTSTAENESNKVNDAKEKVIDAQNDLNKAKSDYDMQFETFKLESENRITENEATIAQIKANSKNASKSVKADLDRDLAVLEQKNEDLKEKVRDHKNEGNEKWEAFKVEFNHDMDNLGQSLKDLGKKNTH